MIKGLYETHLYVSDLERSVTFYGETLGLELCHRDEARRIAFFWIGQPRGAMLGIWEKPANAVEKRHFAFSCSAGDILEQGVAYLLARSLQPYNFLKDGSMQPMVFAWMPAIALYFDDPDGNALEFIAILPGTPQPELGVISYADWMAAQPGQ